MYISVDGYMCAYPGDTGSAFDCTTIEEAHEHFIEQGFESPWENVMTKIETLKVLREMRHEIGLAVQAGMELDGKIAEITRKRDAAAKDIQNHQNTLISSYRPEVLEDMEKRRRQLETDLQQHGVRAERFVRLVELAVAEYDAILADACS